MARTRYNDNYFQRLSDSWLPLQCRRILLVVFAIFVTIISILTSMRNTDTFRILTQKGISAHFKSYKIPKLDAEDGIPYVANQDMSDYMRAVFAHCPANKRKVHDISTCERRLQSSIKPVICEIYKNLKVFNALDSLEAFSASSCLPKVINYDCSRLKESQLPCEKTFVLQQFDYATQYNCLLNIVDGFPRRGSSNRVPRILHLVWYYNANEPLEFHTYIGIISAMHFFRPEIVFFWNDGNFPKNKWWQELISAFNQPPELGRLSVDDLSVTASNGFTPKRKIDLYGSVKLYSVNRSRPATIYGNNIVKVQHSSDLVRLEALLLFGGLYIDTDMVAVRNLDALLNNSVTLGREEGESPATLGNAVIFAQQNASYLYMWHHTYESFDQSEWGEHSTIGSYRLASECPSYVHVEPRSLMTPSRLQPELLYESDVSLRNNYMFHLWWRFRDGRRHRKPTSPDVIRTWKSTVGRIFRLLYLGLCENNCG